VTNYNVVVSAKGAPIPAFDMSATNIPFIKPDINGNTMADFVLISNNNCTTCVGNASAAFVGNQAQGVITTYSIGDTTNPANGANGAAVLVRP